MKIIEHEKAKKIQKEEKLISGMNFDFRLFNEEADSLRYIKDSSGNYISNSPNLRLYNLFNATTLKESLNKAKKVFKVDSFFHTRGKYLYKTLCLEYKGYYFFLYFHREKGDGIDTNCQNSELYYEFLIKLLRKCGHKIPKDFFKEYLNPPFKLR